MCEISDMNAPKLERARELSIVPARCCIARARRLLIIRCCTVSARATEAGAGTGIRNQPGQWRALLATSSYRAPCEMNQAPIRKRSVNSPPSLRTERANSSRSVGHAHSLLSFPRLRSRRQHQTSTCKRLLIAPKHPEACRLLGS